MSSIYLSMRASDATPGRALRFERGRPIAEFSLGRRAAWQTSVAGGADRQLWVSFDGHCVVLRRDAESPPVSIDGRPLSLDAERILQLPCRIELGDVKWIVDDQAPPFAALDAGALDRAALAPAKEQSVQPRAFEPVAVAKCVVVTSASGKVSSARARPVGLVAAEHERTLADGHATSVMPLDVMLRRGLIPSPSAPEPQVVLPRRRRPLEARRSGMSAVARWSARILPWLDRLEPKRWLASMPRRRLAWGLLVVPMLPIVAYALRPESPGGARSSASFETNAWAASDERRGSVAARHEGPSVRTDPSAPPDSSPRTDLPAEVVARPDVGVVGDAKPPARAQPPAPAAVPLPPLDARSGPTGERLAVDALAAGDKARAQALYAELARRSRDNAAFAEAARILSKERNAAQGAERRAGSQDEERLANGVTTSAR